MIVRHVCNNESNYARMFGATYPLPFVQHIANEGLLAVVAGQNRDLVGRVTQEPHVLI